MKADKFLIKEFGFERAMTINRHIEWLEHYGAEHLTKKYNLQNEPTEEELGLAKWKEHMEYFEYLSMPLCFEDDPSSGDWSAVKSSLN